MDDVSNINFNKSNSIQNKSRQYVVGKDLEITAPTKKEGASSVQKNEFKEVLSSCLNQDRIGEQKKAADKEMAGLAPKELDEVMAAVDDAKESFDMMMDVRNKLVDAYKELSKM